MDTSRTMIGLVLSGLMLAGCGIDPANGLLSQPPMDATPAPGTLPGDDPGAPLAAFLYVHGDPPSVLDPTHITLVSRLDGNELLLVDLGAGDEITASRDLLPATYGMAVDGVDCAGDIPLEGGRETDVLLVLEHPHCKVIVEGSHEPGSAHEFASISGRVVGFAPGFTVELISLDSPTNPVPEPRPLDEGGRFFVTSIPPGRYAVVLLSGRNPIARAEIELVSGESLPVDLQPR